MSDIAVQFDEVEPYGDVRGNAQAIRGQGRQDDADALTSLQDQIDAIIGILRTGTTITVAAGFSAADAEAAGFRKTTVYPVLLTADTAITYAAPALAGEVLAVDIRQNGTGGYNITWDTMFRGGPTEIGVLLANTRYLVLFIGIDISGTLKWVRFSVQLDY